MGPSIQAIEEHSARKAQYLAAKMGLIHLCDNCHAEIYLPERHPFIEDCAQPKWLHKDWNKNACYNDDSDGTAWPMSENDLEDLHDDIMKDDWWYEGKDPF